MVKAYVCALRLFSQDDFRQVELRDRLLQDTDLTPAARGHSAVLFYILVMLLEGSPLLLVQRCQQGCGLEAWRQLHLRYARHGGAVAMRTLHAVLEFVFPTDLMSYADALVQWDLLVASTTRSLLPTSWRTTSRLPSSSRARRSP